MARGNLHAPYLDIQELQVLYQIMEQSYEEVDRLYRLQQTILYHNYFAGVPGHATSH
jgi:hypothetical protein